MRSGVSVWVRREGERENDYLLNMQPGRDPMKVTEVEINLNIVKN